MYKKRRQLYCGCSFVQNKTKLQTSHSVSGTNLDGNKMERENRAGEGAHCGMQRNNGGVMEPSSGLLISKSSSLYTRRINSSL